VAKDRHFVVVFIVGTFRLRIRMRTEQCTDEPSFDACGQADAG
jgi:hypothetical protein